MSKEGNPYPMTTPGELPRRWATMNGVPFVPDHVTDEMLTAIVDRLRGNMPDLDAESAATMPDPNRTTD